MKTKSIIGGELCIVVRGAKEEYAFTGTFIDYIIISDKNCMILRIDGKDVVIPTDSILFFNVLSLNNIDVVEKENKEVT